MPWYQYVVVDTVLVIATLTVSPIHGQSMSPGLLVSTYVIVDTPLAIVRVDDTSRPLIVAADVCRSAVLFVSVDVIRRTTLLPTAGPAPDDPDAVHSDNHGNDTHSVAAPVIVSDGEGHAVHVLAPPTLYVYGAHSCNGAIGTPPGQYDPGGQRFANADGELASQ